MPPRLRFSMYLASVIGFAIGLEILVRHGQLIERQPGGRLGRRYWPTPRAWSRLGTHGRWRARHAVLADDRCRHRSSALVPVGEPPRLPNRQCYRLAAPA